MSAAPVPKPDDADPEGWALLENLRRRLDDQTAQTRKTAAQVTQLADSIAALVEGQRRRSKWLNLNSFVAYVMFTLLCCGAFYFTYRSRARELVGARDRAIAERDAASIRAAEATANAVARESADARALQAYQLLLAGKRDDAAKVLATLEHAPLSRFDHEVLADRAKQAQAMQLDAALKTANAALKAGRFGDVAPPLEQVLALDPNGPRAPEMHYVAGVGYAKAGELDKAIAHLEAAVAADVAEDDARFQLAAALDRAGKWAKARAEYDRFATAKPQSPLAVFAMRRSATLARVPQAPQAVPQPQPQPQPQPKQEPQPQPQPEALPENP